MTKRQTLPPEIEQLSAYLDGELTSRQRMALEARLRTQAALRAELEQLQKTRSMLRSLPRLRAPHNFTLSPQTARVSTQTRLPALFGAVSALSSALLIFLVIAGLLVGIPGQPASQAEDSQVMMLEETVVVEQEGELPMAQEMAAPTEPLLGGAIAPDDGTSRYAEPTIEAAQIPPSAASPTPDAGLVFEIQGISTPTPALQGTAEPLFTAIPLSEAYPAALPEEESLPRFTATGTVGEALPEGAAPKVPEPTPLPDTSPLSTALFAGELFLAMIALLAGITALVLMIRFHR
jgi:hypothetical protein